MKRALVASYYAPQVDRDTGSRRVMALVDALLEAGWHVSFASVHSDRGRYERALQQKGVAIHDGSAGLDEVLRGARFDLAVLAYWPVAERYLPAIRRVTPETRVVVDSIDLHFLRYARQLLGSGSRVLDDEFGREMAGEINTYAAADGVLAVSDKEAQLVDDLTGEPDLTWAVPLGVHLPAAVAPCEVRRGSVFVGNFQHAPNVDAVAFLCQEVLPHLDPAIVGTHPVYVVGSGMTEQVRRLGDGVPGVRMVGWVPDLEPYLQRARVALVPLRHGAGVKGKLLEAMAAGTPAVSTTVGIEGLDVVDQEQALVADSADAFAAALQRLLTDDALWTQLARGGRSLVERRYSQATSRRRFLDLATTVLAKPPKPARIPGLDDGGAARYDAHLRFQDRHRTPGSARDIVRSRPSGSRPVPGPRVLVVGVCLTDQVNTADHVVAAMGAAQWCQVSQRWAALGSASPGTRVEAVTALTVQDTTPKFALVNRLLAGVELDAFDYVLVTDDDVVLPDGFLDAFLEQQQGLDFAIAQPARTRTSSIDHPIVEQQLGVIARRTQFVEIGPVVSFHRSAFPLVFPFDLVSPMGWGYENVWALELLRRGLRMGIVDATPVDHSLRPTLANYSWSAGDAGRDALLERREHLPLDECMRVLEVFPAGA